MSLVNPSIDIESIGFSSVKGRTYTYHILIRIKEGSSSFQYSYNAVVRRRMFRRTFKLIQVYPTAVSPEKYHNDSHACVKDAVQHLMSDLGNW